MKGKIFTARFELVIDTTRILWFPSSPSSQSRQSLWTTYLLSEFICNALSLNSLRSIFLCYYLASGEKRKSFSSLVVSARVVMINIIVSTSSSSSPSRTLPHTTNKLNLRQFPLKISPPRHSRWNLNAN